MNAQTAHTPTPNKHPMVLMEGWAASRRRRYAYRGHSIDQTYRTHDVRNKTTNGYSWTVDGGYSDHGTRTKAKAYVDELIRIDEHTKASVFRPAEDRARAALNPPPTK